MVVPELKMTKKVTADTGGADAIAKDCGLKERRRLNPEDSTFCQRTLKLTDTLEVVQAVRHLTSDKAT